jgi:hypothetical protein
MLFTCEDRKEGWCGITTPPDWRALSAGIACYWYEQCRRGIQGASLSPLTTPDSHRVVAHWVYRAWAGVHDGSHSGSKKEAWGSYTPGPVGLPMSFELAC